MGWFKKSARADDLDAVRAQMDTMASRLDTTTAENASLQQRVESLSEALTEERSAKRQLEQRLGEVASSVEADTSAIQLAQIRDRLDGIDDQIDNASTVDPAEITELREQVKALDERLDGVDERVTSIATELANQLSELSRDIEQIETPDQAQERALVQVRNAQQRLAQEQARYQIAFKREIAEIADRLRDDT